MDITRRHFLGGTLGGLALVRGSVAAAPGPQQLSQYDPQVKKLLAQMTLDEKIGQMTQPDQSYLKNLDDIEKYHLGSLLSGGDSDPKSGNDLESWTKLYEGYQTRALKTRLRIPLLYGIDAVHGNSNLIGAVIFPHNVGLGCTRNAKLVEEASRITAEEVRATGINWAFAPCVAVPQDIRWGRTYEGFSESPDVVKELGEAAVRGLQWQGLQNPLAVLACSKHYMGDGGTTWGTGMIKNDKTGERYPLDRGDTRGDEATLRKLFLQGYITSLRAGVGSIMPSYSSWNGEKCSGNKHILTDILKQELGFDGFIISDYNALSELPGSYKDQIQKSINAGMDMVMIPERYEEFFDTLKQLVAEGAVPGTRIDDAVTRILRTKFAMGMMDPQRSQMHNEQAYKNFGSLEHRRVARQCVRESIVLLKNSRHVLPITRGAKRIHVAGRSADDIGLQCGGWTITWQGRSGATTKGATILDGIRTAAREFAQVTHSRDGSGAAGASVGVVVIGENPYAEMNGDRTDLRLAPEDIAAVNNVKAAGIPVVVVIVSGRPLIIDDIVDKADAIVAAWLPGTEGDGVADVLLGAFRPKGKLSYTWPSGASTSLHRGDAGYKTMYEFGYGRGY